jgi:small GTP-binding protein
MDKKMITKKVVLIGDFATGKTSLIRRYVDNQFNDEYLTTIGVKISKKNLQLSDEIELQLMVWDIEGHTDVKATNPAYVMGAHGVILVGDITREKSIKNIPLHLELVKKILKKVPIVIALNKSDLIPDQTEIEKKVLDLDESHLEVLKVFDTSAKNSKNVEAIFTTLSQALLL